MDEEALEQYVFAPPEDDPEVALPPLEAAGHEDGAPSSFAHAGDDSPGEVPIADRPERDPPRPKKRARRAIGGGHRLSFKGGIVWCRSCGHYTEKRTYGLADDCAGEATGVYISRRRRLQDGRHPLTSKPLE
jgi:ribosomal protein L32